MAFGFDTDFIVDTTELSTRQKYTRYIASDEWQLVRHAAFAKRGRRCEVCPSSDRLHVHHLFYPEPVTSTTVDHVMILCERCHNNLHQYWPQQAYAKREQGIPNIRWWIRTNGHLLSSDNPKQLVAQQKVQAKQKRKAKKKSKKAKQSAQEKWKIRHGWR